MLWYLSSLKFGFFNGSMGENWRGIFELRPFVWQARQYSTFFICSFRHTLLAMSGPVSSKTNILGWAAPPCLGVVLVYLLTRFPPHHFTDSILPLIPEGLTIQDLKMSHSSCKLFLPYLPWPTLNNARRSTVGLWFWFWLVSINCWRILRYHSYLCLPQLCLQLLRWLYR